MLYDSKYASQVRKFLRDLKINDLEVTASTAIKGNAEAKTRAIDTILRNTDDLDRLFSYRRITTDILFDYLIKLKGKNRKIELSRKTKREEIISIIKGIWNENEDERQKPKKNKNEDEGQSPKKRPKLDPGKTSPHTQLDRSQVPHWSRPAPYKYLTEDNCMTQMQVWCKTSNFTSSLQTSVGASTAITDKAKRKLPHQYH
nr:uncharacterized protein LOC113805733 [Penaeus vannamei]XP_027212585.1 uncharacterized protein LOC113805733 [Penaeus vannamei]XP_027212586.1 uncharacterized protein LOC113805733 [Penaeus vannamei]XP_027212587.1 uncharacterized protein LOC113805733 [Penaeus vannamei]XP_027212588.1 uncharacterized protein LOC113805733 [Penaeus vannamei]